MNIPSYGSGQTLRLVFKTGQMVDLTMPDGWNFIQGMAMAKLHGFFSTENFFTDYDNVLSFGLLGPNAPVVRDPKTVN